MNTRLKGRFCPRCGGPADEDDDLCGKCRLSGIRWFECASRVVIIICPGCGARKVANTWADCDMERDTIAREVASGAATFHPDVKRPQVHVRTITDISTNRSLASLYLKGTIYGESVEGSCTVEIRWQREQCSRCNRISGSYYEGVIQIRALERRPTDNELQRVVHIAYDVEEAMQAAGERLSYISDVTETRDGLDIVIGSQHIGQAISTAIVRELGGRFTTHPKLVGEKDGRQLFRITYSLRLPRYQRGDVVRIGKRFAEVVYSDTKQVRLFDLADGTTRTVREPDIGEIIGNVRNAEEAMVAYADGDMLGILDPVSGVTTEVHAGPRIRALAGDRIRLLKNRDQIVLIR